MSRAGSWAIVVAVGALGAQATSVLRRWRSRAGRDARSGGCLCWVAFPRIAADRGRETEIAGRDHGYRLCAGR